MRPSPQETADSVTFTEEILNGKLHFLCSVIYITEKWKKSLGKGKTFTALLTDLYNAFDCFTLELIIDKLNAYCFSMLSSRLIHGYSPNLKQRTSINSSFSSWEEILFDVSQEAITRPLLFKIFICDLFLF